MTELPKNPVEPEIILDLSRLLSRIAHPTPTGVDRCEMAYARGLMDVAGDRVNFVAVHPLGCYGHLSRNAVQRFLRETEHRWSTSGFSSRRAKYHFVVRNLAALFPRRGPTTSPAPPRVYVQASPSNLAKPSLIRRILRQEQAHFICLVHDLIPVQFPEYARPGGVERHRTRIRTLAREADGIIANSHSTMASLQPWLDEGPRPRRTAVAHLGCDLTSPACTQPASSPYFVCIGTIEPRKNHLLLLNVWRRLAEICGTAAVPKLIIIGRRGWENEQVIDMLERCETLVGCVEERNGLSDRETMRVLAGARALLLPSFAEGYGMPVSEALHLQVPVICSDLPALREAGGDVPDYLDPLDGIAWMEAITDYSSLLSNRRARQLAALSGRKPPTWSDHISVVLEMIAQVANAPR